MKFSVRRPFHAWLDDKNKLKLDLFASQCISAAVVGHVEEKKSRKGVMVKGGSKVALQQSQDLGGGLLRHTDLVLDLWLPVGGTGVKDKVWMKLPLDVVEKLL